MLKRLVAVGLLLIAAIAGAQTTSSNILPSSTGLDLGAPNQKWDLFSQDIDVYRSLRLNDTLGNHWMQPVPGFATSLVTCTKDDGTRCYFDTGSATTNGLRDCGVWNAQTTYPLQCVVQYQGSSWVAVAPTVGIAPGTDNNVDWHLFAIAGSNGVNGTNGSNGAPGTPGYSPNQIISGGGVVWTSNYNYTVSAVSYIIQNQGYSAPQTNISLAASDVTNPRCDLVYANSSGAVGVITGTAAAQPACPVVDPATQVLITQLRVDANSTQPGTIVQTDIYHENTEWTMSRTGTPINLASTNNPHAGTVDIEATNAVTGNFFTATDPLAGTVDLATRNNFIFYIRPKATWTTNRSITIQWYNGSSPKCTAVSFTQGSFGFNSANLAYQQIVIPTSLFACNGLPLTAVRFTVAGTSSVSFGWYIDDIILQGGVPPSVGSNAMVWQDPWNATRAYAVNDTVSYQNNGYVAMSQNVGQTPSQTSTIWHPITNAGPPFVSLSANVAASGILRLANAEKACWRNSTNSGDLCWWLDSSNVWNLDGTSGSELGMQEEASASATTPGSGVTVFVDSTSHLPCTKTSGGLVTCAGAGAGTPAGANTQVQFNDAGSFGADSQFVYNKGTHILTVGTSATQGTIDMLGAAGAPANPSANYCRQYFDTTAGVVKWINSSGTTCGPSSSSAGGSDKQIQYNNASALGGISNGTAGQVMTSNGAGSAPSFQLGGLTLLEQHTASSSAALNFTTAISSSYDEYMIEFVNIVPATTGVILEMRMSTDGGSTYDSTNLYSWTSWRSTDAGQANATSGALVSNINITNSTDTISTTANWSVNGSIKLMNPGGALYKQVFGQMAYLTGASTALQLTFRGVYTSTTAVNAFQFFMSSGNIASGTIRVYGLAK